MAISLRSRPVQSGSLAFALLAASVVAILAFNALRSTMGVEALYPATVPPVDSLCRHAVDASADGTVSPLFCSDGSINTAAWTTIAADDPEVMRLGRKATPADVMGAIRYDLTVKMTGPRECSAATLSAAYYGWNFHINPVAGLTLECAILK